MQFSSQHFIDFLCMSKPLPSIPLTSCVCFRHMIFFALLTINRLSTKQKSTNLQEHIKWTRTLWDKGELNLFFNGYLMSINNVLFQFKISLTVWTFRKENMDTFVWTSESIIAPTYIYIYNAFINCFVCFLLSCVSPQNNKR